MKVTLQTCDKTWRLLNCTTNFENFLTLRITKVLKVENSTNFYSSESCN
jgi:hypothetical protein